MQRQLFEQNRQTQGQETADSTDATLKNVKWRRAGVDRRCVTPAGEGSDYVEKRSCGDRRHDYMTLVSRIIFPRGWAKN